MDMTRRNRPVEITDAPEHRSIPINRVEMRENADENEFILTGYASTFEEYEMYGGPEKWGWIERIDRGAFDKTLREKPDLHLLINHQGMPLARTKSGTLDLSVDDHGLKVEARLDRRDPEAQALAVKMERGDMDEMSFAFRVKGQEWRAAPGFEDDDESYRLITEVSLHKGDVSVVNWGANPTTHAEISPVRALQVIAETDVEALAEIRSEDEAVTHLKIAQEKLSALRDGILPEGEAREAEAKVDEEVIEDADRDEVREEAGSEDISARFDELTELSHSIAESLTETIDGLTAIILKGEDRNDDHPEDCDCDECVGGRSEESAEDAESRGMSLREAMAFRGVIVDDDETPLSLSEALAFAENA